MQCKICPFVLPCYTGRLGVGSYGSTLLCPVCGKFIYTPHVRPFIKNVFFCELRPLSYEIKQQWASIPESVRERIDIGFPIIFLQDPGPGLPDYLLGVGRCLACRGQLENHPQIVWYDFHDWSFKQ